MSETIPVIKSITGHGLMDDMETAVINVSTKNSGAVQFAVHASALPHIILNFREIGSKIQQHRAGLPNEFQLDDVAAPLEARAFRTGVSHGDRIVVQVDTTAGLPVLVHMSRRQAKELSSKIREALNMVPPKTS